MWNHFWRSPRVLRGIGRLAAAYLMFVRRTTRFVREPADPFAHALEHFPFIYACWHGSHLLGPLLGVRPQDTSAMASKSADGEINAEIARRIGLTVIRGSGGRSAKKSARKGGAAALLAMKAELARGRAVAQTADVPRGESRRCGLGIITLARHSGRPILPVVAVTRWGITLPTWDRTRIPLPFGRGALVVGDPIYVPADADAARLELARQEVEASLNRVQERADELAGLRIA